MSIDFNTKMETFIQGENGATFIPFVSDEGIISWTNNKGLSNPESINIKGEDGINGESGINGATFIPDISTDYILSWSNDKDLPNPKPIKLVVSETSTNGENGATFIPFVSDEGIISWTNNKGLSNPIPVNIKGDNGTNGSDGASAFEIATNNGFIGTKVDWLESLHGAQGDNGNDYILTEDDKTEISNSIILKINNEIGTHIDEINRVVI